VGVPRGAHSGRTALGAAGRGGACQQRAGAFTQSGGARRARGRAGGPRGRSVGAYVSTGRGAGASAYGGTVRRTRPGANLIRARARRGAVPARAAQTPTFHVYTRVTTSRPLVGSSLTLTCASLTSECLTGPTTESPGTTPVHRLMPSGAKVYHTTPSYRLTSLAGRLSSRCPGPRLQTRATAWPHPAARGTREWRGYGPGSGRVRPTRR